MKDKKRVKSSSIIIVVAILLVASLITTSAKAVNKKLINKYVALGDSISLESDDIYNLSYTSLINDFLVSLNKNLVYENLGKSGVTSSDLINIINENESTIQDADLITISIGGNNILMPILNILKENLNIESLSQCTREELEEIILNILNNQDTKLQILDEVDNFRKDFNTIIELINTLAPNAEVYINTIYNPINVEGEIFNFFENQILLINDIISKGNKDYNIIDSYDLFKDQVGLEFDAYTGNFNIYPTKSGHAILATQVISQYGDYVSLDIDKITSSSDYISGKTIPLTNIIVLSEDGIIGTTKTNLDGEFKLEISPLKTGTNLEILVYDKNIFSILYKFEKLVVRKDIFTS